jgi:hypothetical protein
VVSEEATRLWESNAKLSEDLEGESTRHFLSPFSFCLPLAHSDVSSAAPRMRVYRAGMTSKLAEQKLELNSALLKVIKKDNSFVRLLEQLESKPGILTPSLPFLRAFHNPSPYLFSSETRVELEQS